MKKDLKKNFKNYDFILGWDKFYEWLELFFET